MVLFCNFFHMKSIKSKSFLVSPSFPSNTKSCNVSWGDFFKASLKEHRVQYRTTCCYHPVAGLLALMQLHFPQEALMLLIERSFIAEQNCLKHFWALGTLESLRPHYPVQSAVMRIYTFWWANWIYTNSCYVFMNTNYWYKIVCQNQSIQTERFTI